MGKGQDLIFTAIVSTKPEVKLGKYKGIELKKVEYNVSEEDINHELGHMAEWVISYPGLTDYVKEINWPIAQTFCTEFV